MTATTALAAWLARTGLTKTDLSRAATDDDGNPMRYATVLAVVEGHVPGVAIAKRLAAATRALGEERALGVEPVTPAQILGVANWASAAEAS